MLEESGHGTNQQTSGTVNTFKMSKFICWQDDGDPFV